MGRCCPIAFGFVLVRRFDFVTEIIVSLVNDSDAGTIQSDPMPTSQVQSLLIQVGVMATVARFSNPDQLPISRDDQVVCQTGRGLELGTVKSVSDRAVMDPEQLIGPVIRIAGDSDLLAFERMEKNRIAGVQACSDWLAESGFQEVLLDAEVTLDGQRVYFHFLGEVNYELEKATEDLVEVFDKATGVRQFTQAVITGCGPTCGSDGSGCGTTSSGCTACSLKGSCGSKKKD